MALHGLLPCNYARAAGMSGPRRPQVTSARPLDRCTTGVLGPRTSSGPALVPKAKCNLRKPYRCRYLMPAIWGWTCSLLVVRQPALSPAYLTPPYNTTLSEGVVPSDASISSLLPAVQRLGEQLG